MEIRKTYKYKLKLTVSQERTIDRYIGVCRMVYNMGKDIKELSWRGKQESVSGYDLSNQLPAIRSEYEWVREVPAQTLQDAIDRLDKSFKSFFKGGGYPRWAKKGKYRSVTFKSVKRDKKPNRVCLPKIGSVKFFNSRPLEGKLRTATVTKEIDGYYICISTIQVCAPIHPNPCLNTIGLDMGVAHFVTMSDGNQVPNPSFLKEQAKRMAREQRSLARKKKGSKNRNKQKVCVARLHNKINRQRKDFLQKHSTAITKRYKTVVVEKLSIKNMSGSAKGTMEAPGRNVRAKAGLNRSILDAGWGMFFDMLEYKQVWKGEHLIRVDPKGTSLSCSECGHMDKLNRISQSMFHCVKCGHEENADDNAAKNIKERGLGKSSVSERKVLAYA